MTTDSNSDIKYAVPPLLPMAIGKPRQRPPQYSEIRNLVMGRVQTSPPTARAGVDFARRNLTRARLLELLDGVFFSTLFDPDKRPFRSAPVREYGEFKPERAYSQIPLATEIVWCASLLVWQSQTIRRFVVLSTEFGNALLGGQHEEASAVLDRVESELGLSMWLIEAKLLCLQSASGLEAQKEFAKELREIASGSFAAFVAHYVSQRNETSVTIARFNSRLEKNAESWKISQPLRDYIGFRVTGEVPSSHRSIANLLRIDAEMSIVDLWETMIAALLKLLCDDPMQLQDAVQEALTILPDVGDFRISKLLLLAGEADVSLLDFEKRAHDVENALWRGDWMLATTEADRLLAESPCDGAAISAKVQALARTRTPSNLEAGIRGTITSAMRDVVAKNDNYLSALSEIEKLSVNLRVLPLNNLLRALVLREAAKAPGDELRFLRVGLLSSKSLSPAEIAGLPISMHEAVLSRLITEGGTGPDIEAAFIMCGVRDATYSNCGAEDNLDLARLRYAMVSADFESAYQLSVKLGRSNDLIIKREAVSCEVQCLLERNDLRAILRRVSEACLDDSGIEHSLPLEAAIKGRKYHELALMASSLSTAITLSLYLGPREDEEQLYNLRAIWDETLAQHGVRFPSELAAICEQFDKKQLIYFLATVCIPQIMDISLDLEGTKALFEERIRICSLLIELDPDHLDEYQEEIVALSKALKLQEGIRLFDSSRVHVDVDALARWAGRELRETFNRYKALLDAGLTMPDVDFDEAIRLFLQTRNAIPERFMEVPSGSGDHLLLEMIESIRERFLNDPEHGLNCFLSMRVRHGSLSGVLRGPVEQRGLVTVRDSTTKQYRPNIVWSSRFSGADSERQMRMDSIFASFSETYDSIIDELNSSVIRVRTDAVPSGAFYIDITGVWVRYLKSKVVEGASFEDFVVACITEIRGLLRPCIDNVRRILREDVREQVTEAFRTLQTDVADCLVGCTYTELQGAIAEAFTEAQTSIENVADWFRGGVGVAYDANYTLDQIIDVAVDVSRNTRRGFVLDPERDVRVATRMAASVFSEVVDILYVVFGNVHDRSMVISHPWVKIAVWQDDTGMLKIRVESEVATGVHSQAKEDELARLRNLLDSDDYRNHVGTEGNSGFFKIKRTVAAHNKHALRFGYVNPTLFYVEAEMSLLYTDDESNHTVNDVGDLRDDCSNR